MKENELKRKGRWTEEEDEKLRDYVGSNGGRRWDTVARKLDLGRSGNSCRLRWVNYLSFIRRPGEFNEEERLLIIQLQSEWGNKWSKIAKQLPGRTDNDIKNFWNTRVKKKPKQESTGAAQLVAAAPCFTTTMSSTTAAAATNAAQEAEARSFTTMITTADHAFTIQPPPLLTAAGSGNAATSAAIQFGAGPAFTTATSASMVPPPQLSEDAFLTLPPPLETTGGSISTVFGVGAADYGYSLDFSSYFLEHAHLWNPANLANYYPFDL